MYTTSTVRYNSDDVWSTGCMDMCHDFVTVETRESQQRLFILRRLFHPISNEQSVEFDKGDWRWNRWNRGHLHRLSIDHEGPSSK